MFWLPGVFIVWSTNTNLISCVHRAFEHLNSLLLVMLYNAHTSCLSVSFHIDEKIDNICNQFVLLLICLACVEIELVMRPHSVPPPCCDNTFDIIRRSQWIGGRGALKPVAAGFTVR